MRGISAVARRIGQERDDLQHFEKRAGPSVSQNQRDGMRSLAAFVNEVNTDAVDGAAMVMEGGHCFQLCLPVEAIFPVVAELSQITAIEAIVPSRAGYLIGPAGTGQTGTKIFDRSFG